MNYYLQDYLIFLNDIQYYSVNALQIRMLKYHMILEKNTVDFDIHNLPLVIYRD